MSESIPKWCESSNENSNSVRWQITLSSLLNARLDKLEPSSELERSSAGLAPKNNNGRFNQKHFLQLIAADLPCLSPRELGQAFVSAAFLTCAMRPLRDQLWLHSRSNNEDRFSDFVSQVFNRELAPLSYLTPIFSDLSGDNLKIIEKKAAMISKETAEIARSMISTPDLRTFADTSLREMQSLVSLENEMISAQKKGANANYLGNSLYRAFDLLDQVLWLDYELDEQIALSSKERTFPGTGIGVQTSYSSVLVALEQIKPQKNSRIIDLGSGYGRLGFVTGLLRPDIEFIGYEFVNHRVQVSHQAALKVGISDHVKFVTQDLSDRTFKIPDADIYYMYDPFNQDTYQYVTQQLQEIGQRKKLTIATKGRANEWFLKAFEGDNWEIDATQDEGTMVLFRSLGSSPAKLPV